MERCQENPVDLGLERGEVRAHEVDRAEDRFHDVRTWELGPPSEIIGAVVLKDGSEDVLLEATSRERCQLH